MRAVGDLNIPTVPAATLNSGDRHRIPELGNSVSVPRIPRIHDWLQISTLLLAVMGLAAAIYDRSALAFIGSAAVIGIFCTLRAVSNQTVEIARSIGAMNRQAESIEKQSGILQDSAQRELRAYINVESGLVRFLGANRYQAEVHVKNFGQTPAHDLEMWLQVTEPQGYPLKDVETWPVHQTRNRSILPPGAKTILAEVPRSIVPSLPSNFMTGYEIGTPQKTIFVYGELIYTDAFQQRRSTKYRLMFGGPYPSRARRIKKIQDGVEIETGVLQWDAEGNEAD
jgi:hypothetical protein